MNKNELELQKVIVKADLVGKLFTFLERVVTVSGWVLGLYIIFQGLLGIVQASPASIEALSGFIKELRISNILLTLTTVGAGFAWQHERRGKKRAIKKLSEARKQLEREDPYRGASELDENGHTPK